MLATVVGGRRPLHRGVHEHHSQWDDERRHEVREALLATGVPYATDTWEVVARELDGYAYALENERLTTCRATRRSSNEAAFASQLLCLERHQGALEHAVALLGAADRALVEQAVPLVLGLPPVAECLALDGPRSPAASPSPQAQELAMRLDRARNLIAAGRHDQAFDLAAQAATEAEAQDDPLLRAEALLVEGRARMGAGRAEAARVMLEAASTAALRHGSDELVVAANANLVEVVGIALAEPDRGLMLAEWAVSLAERPSVRRRTQAVAHTVHGHLSTTRGELSPAEHHYERALELLRREHGDDHLALVEPLDGLATALRQRGELGLALAHRRRALALLLGSYGEQHPTTAITRANLAAILRDQGELAEARRELELAIAVLTRALGADHPALAAPHSGLATVLDEQGEPAKADPEHREAIRIWTQALGPDHPDVATARYNLAASLGRRGQHDAAIVELERALGILRGHPPTPQLVQQAATVLRELGRRHRERGDLVAAEARYREGIAALERSEGEHDATMASLLNGLGRVVLGRGDAPQAEQLHRRALAIYEQAGGPKLLEAAHTHRHLARALIEQAQWDRAQEHVEAALERYEHHVGVDEAHVADARALRDTIANAR